MMEQSLISGAGGTHMGHLGEGGGVGVGRSPIGVSPTQQLRNCNGPLSNPSESGMGLGRG